MTNSNIKASRSLFVKAITGELRFSSVVLLILAFPYYRSLDHRTLRPIQNLINSRNVQEIQKSLDIWISGKQDEFAFVNVAVRHSAKKNSLTNND